MFPNRLNIFSLIFLGCFLPCSVLSQPQDTLSSHMGFTQEQLDKIQEIAKMIQRDYVDSVDVQKLLYGALRGMMNELDPHSEFLTPEEYTGLQQASQRRYEDIGIILRRKNPGMPPTILGVLLGTPAWKVGIRSDDEIIKVDGADTKIMHKNQVYEKIRGPADTSVQLTIRRSRANNLPQEFTLQVTRTWVQYPAVHSRMLNERIGYLYLDAFSANSYNEVYMALWDLNLKGMKALVLDLRGNGGGYVDQAADIAGLFLKKDDLLFCTTSKTHPTEETRVFSDGSYINLPLVVLVNSQTASSSEIVAGAIKDNCRGEIIGSKTYGKGTMQYVTPLTGVAEGCASKLTCNRYENPSGHHPMPGNGIASTTEIIQDKQTEEKIEEQILSYLLQSPPSSPMPDEALEKAILILSR